MRDTDELFAALAKSSFRSRFKLGEKDVRYVKSKGLESIRAHARDFVESRLGAAAPKNDGRQTPMKGHPVFISQHAVGACCRKCLGKWHGIGRGYELTEDEIDYIVSVIMLWLERQIGVEGSNCGEGLLF
jgi:hypothetical protein